MATGFFFILFFIVGFINIRDIYHFFEQDLDFKLTVTSPGDIIWIYFTMSGLVGLVATIPILALQIWLFVKPALTNKERKASIAYIPALFILFIAGLVFGYLVFTKLIFPFLLDLNDGMFHIIFTVDNYFHFLFRVTIPFGILFEIPVISMFLTKVGVLTPAFMKKTRKYAYLILVIVGAAVTPPDFILQIVVAVPLILLYEISIILSGMVYRKKQKQHELFMQQ
jgi:sec-independent protein translocase protein TatC